MGGGYCSEQGLAMISYNFGKGIECSKPILNWLLTVAKEGAIEKCGQEFNAVWRDEDKESAGN